MTIPINARATNDGRVYTWPSTGEEFPSITTIIKNGVPKASIPPWAAKMAALFALENLPLLQALKERSNEQI